MNKEGWIKEQLSNLKSKWPVSTGSMEEAALRRAIEIGIKAPEFDEYELKYISNDLIEIVSNRGVILKMWYGEYGVPSKEQAQAIADKILEILNA